MVLVVDDERALHTERFEFELTEAESRFLLVVANGTQEPESSIHVAAHCGDACVVAEQQQDAGEVAGSVEEVERVAQGLDRSVQPVELHEGHTDLPVRPLLHEGIAHRAEVLPSDEEQVVRLLELVRELMGGVQRPSALATQVDVADPISDLEPFLEHRDA